MNTTTTLTDTTVTDEPISLVTASNPDMPVMLLHPIRKAKANKAGQFSQGSVEYLISKDDDNEVYISITHNDSSGQFSKEAVALSKIESVLANNPNPNDTPAKVLKPAFISRSANNSGFLMAVLIAEGLMRKQDDKAFAYLKIGDWTAWKAQQLLLAIMPTSAPVVASTPVVTTTSSKSISSKATKGQDNQHDRDQKPE